MAVLVEANSILIKCESIYAKIPGGMSFFERNYARKNKNYCCDTELCRFGFMTPDDTDWFLDVLQRLDLVYLEDDIPIDIVVADHTRGLEVSCDWIRLGRAPIDRVNGEKIVTYAELRTGKAELLATPLEWDYDESLTRSSSLILPSEQSKKLRFLRVEGLNNVYLDLTTGKECFVARSVKEKEEEALLASAQQEASSHTLRH